MREPSLSALKALVEETSKWDYKIYVDFMGLEKVEEDEPAPEWRGGPGNRQALKQVQRMPDVDGKLLKVLKVFMFEIKQLLK